MPEVILVHDLATLILVCGGTVLGMTPAIVISVAQDRGAFVVETREGRCAVFCQSAGPTVRAGDVLEGPVLARGSRQLQHADGTCAVVGDSGPVSREDALALLHGRMG